MKEPDWSLLENLRVLYVEDDQDEREGLLRFLRRRLASVEAASNGLEGLNLFKEKRQLRLRGNLLLRLLNRTRGASQ